MSVKTIQRGLAFEEYDGLRNVLLTISEKVRESRTIYRASKREREDDLREEMRDESASLYCEAAHDRTVVRENVRRVCGSLDDLRIWTLRECGRLPEILAGLSYGERWREYFVVRTASRIAWDSGSTEFDALLERLYESDVWTEHSGERDVVRTARRLKEGYWSRSEIKASKRERERERRASMTPEQRKEASRAAGMRRRAAKAKRSGYSAMLDDQPVQTVQTRAA